MENIFISYAREDLDIVEGDIKKEISKINGANPWFDFKNIEAGAESFPQRIKDGIEECFIFLLILSKNSMSKPWPIWEFEFAKEKQKNNPLKKIVLVNIDNSQLTGCFADQSERDIIFWDNHRQHIKLIDNIKEWIEERAKTWYEKGIKLENNNFQEAFHFFKLSADFGCAESQSKLAYYYHTGKNGIIKNEEKAIEWCQKAIEQDYSGGFSLMASIYKQNNDYGSYIAFRHTAASKGWAYSQYELGKEFYDNNDVITAIYWLKQADFKNQPDAQELLGDILNYDFKKRESIARLYYKRAIQNFKTSKDPKYREKIKKVRGKLNNL